MPTASPHPCGAPGCPNLVPHGQSRCERHRKEQKRAYDAQRPNFRQRYGNNWEKIRALILSQEPLCRSCAEAGRTVVATELHHRIPISKGGSHDEENLIPLCADCHKAGHHGEFGWSQYNARRGKAE